MAPRCFDVAMPSVTGIGTDAGQRRHGSSHRRGIRPPRSRHGLDVGDPERHEVAQIVGRQLGEPSLGGAHGEVGELPLEWSSLDALLEGPGSRAVHWTCAVATGSAAVAGLRGVPAAGESRPGE